MKKAVFLFIPALLLVVEIGMQFPVMAAAKASQECSNFSVKHGDQVFFGSNDDMSTDSLADSETIIMIYPPNATGQGYAEFGYFTPEGKYWSRKGALNENGLAYGTMSIPTLPLNPHPEKPISGYDKLFNTLMRKVTTVDEAIQLAMQTDFSSLGDTMSFQIQIADASGDSVVISPGVDGELIFTRKPENQAYLVSTNFNAGLRSDVKWGNEYERHDTTVTLLKQTIAQDNLSEASARNMLDAIHVENFFHFTSSSRVFDLQSGNIYLYYFSQFDDGVRINLVEEFEKGRHQILIEDLFPPETVVRGDTRYQTVRVREMVTLGSIVAAALAFIVSLITWLTLNVLSRSPSRLNRPATKRRLLIGVGVSWVILCWSLLLFIVNTYPPNLIRPVLPLQAMLILGPLGALGAIAAIRAFILLRENKKREKGFLLESASLR